jgi:hypothetical protein
MSGSQLFDWGGRHRNMSMTGMNPATDWIRCEGLLCLETDGVDGYFSTPLNGTSLTELTLSYWISATDGLSRRNLCTIAEGFAKQTAQKLRKLMKELRALLDQRL